MSSRYIPQVGDTVRLLKSETNWWTKEDKEAAREDFDSMDCILEKTPIVTITEVIAYQAGREEYSIKFENGGKWQWTTANNHFELYIPKIKPNKSHNKALIKLIKYADK